MSDEAKIAITAMLKPIHEARKRPIAIMESITEDDESTTRKKSRHDVANADISHGSEAIDVPSSDSSSEEEIEAEHDVANADISHGSEPMDDDNKSVVSEQSVVSGSVLVEKMDALSMTQAYQDAASDEVIVASG